MAVLLALAVALCWGANPLFARRAMLKVDVIATSFYGTLAGLVVITVFSYFSGDLASLPTMRADQLLTFAIVGVINIVLGRTVYYISINKIGAGRSVSIVSSSILVASFIAFFALDERINLKMALGTVMVFVGIFLVARKEE